MSQPKRCKNPSIQPQSGFTLIACLLILLALGTMAAVGLRQALHPLQAAKQQQLRLEVEEHAHTGLVNAERALQNLPALASPVAIEGNTPLAAPTVEVEAFAIAQGQNPLYRIRSTAYAGSSGSISSNASRRVKVSLEAVFTLSPYPKRLSWRPVYE